MALDNQKGEWKVFVDFRPGTSTGKDTRYGLYRLDENGKIEERIESYDTYADAEKMREYLNEKERGQQ